MTNDRTILITGVTGNQGGAVAQAHLATPGSAPGARGQSTRSHGAGQLSFA